MEALAYVHSYSSYEQEAGIEYEFTKMSFNWQKLPNSSWMGLLVVAVFFSTLTAASEASATLYASTPNGGCLNARTSPSLASPSALCVRSGATLKTPVAYKGEWLQLASGRWVYGPYTATAKGGQRGYRTIKHEIGQTARVRPQAGGGIVVLSVGSEGLLVGTLQQRLQDLGYTSVGKVDGAFGRKTQQAVINFQKNHGLKTDGVVGAATLRAMSLGV